MSMITITYNDNKTIDVERGTSLYEVSKMVASEMENKIVGVEINNEVVPMDTQVTRNLNVNFIDMNSINGYRINKNGISFVLEVALKEAFDNKFEVIFNHSTGNGLHLSIEGEENFTLENAKTLKKEMNSILKADERIYNLNVEKKEAINYYNKVNSPEKAANIHNVTNYIVTVYKLRNYINYFYSEMPYSTGSLSKYDLVFLGNNKLVLVFPSKNYNNKIPDYLHYKNVIKCFEDSKNWAGALEIPYLADINKKISESKIEELIIITETHFDNQIYNLVSNFVKTKARFMMFAGPSSSGKTTTTKKIALQLKSRGLDTLVITTDNYFKEREDSPKDEFGNYDFECLECLDLKLMNKQLKELLAGKKVKMPTFNFETGKKEYNDPPVKINEYTIILMEGLHCINDAMTPDIDPKLKYKVYLSPFIPLNIDKHNYISTVDLRLMRRIVRDNRTRARDVGKTILDWNKVRSGERKYIYPYIDKIDAILNTSLIYEVGVLKTFVEPLLYSVQPSSPAYNEARRLINYLKGFFPVPSDYVTDDSILREFIGKSIFNSK